MSFPSYGAARAARFQTLIMVMVKRKGCGGLGGNPHILTCTWTRAHGKMNTNHKHKDKPFKTLSNALLVLSSGIQILQTLSSGQSPSLTLF